MFNYISCNVFYFYSLILQIIKTASWDKLHCFLQIDYDPYFEKSPALGFELECRDRGFIVFLLAGANSAWLEVGRCSGDVIE